MTSGGVGLHSVAKATLLPQQVSDAVYWDTWLVLPIKYCDLPCTTQLLVQVCTVGPRVVYGTTVRVFDEQLRLKRGRQKLTLWPAFSDSSVLSAVAPDGCGPDTSELHTGTLLNDYHSPDCGLQAKVAAECTCYGAAGPQSAKGSAGGSHGFYKFDEKQRLARAREAHDVAGSMPKSPWLQHMTVKAIEVSKNLKQIQLMHPC